jgi:hypothetical protein
MSIFGFRMSKVVFSKPLVALVGAALALSLAALPARAQMGAASKAEMSTASPTVLSAISPFYTAADTAHVANGCGLRNKTSCVINLRGIPPKSKVKKAFLYWAYTSTFGTASSLQKTIYLRGSTILGRLIGNGPDACWCGEATGADTNVVYRANVTSAW